MRDVSILERVIELFSAMTDEEVNQDSELVDDLGISSMDVMFVISSLEEEFHVKISEKEIRRMYTVGDVVDTIVSLTDQTQ